jgi:serine/threonine protein kinase
MGLPALVSQDRPGAFGPYELVEQLGQGGMAVVYRARQRGAAGFSRDVVLKAMLPALVKSQPLVEMFETEARLTAQLRHPNIVQVDDFGVAGGIPYLIMEFLDGKNLSQLRNAMNKLKRRVPIGAAVSIVRDLCNALGYAHHFVDAEGNRMQVIHRDISPSNVMVLRDGSIRLLDFGVAKLSVEAGQAVTTSLKGKFAYMAPEQVNQEPIDRRCDVFAAGIVLHELLTGKRLFGTKSELETLRRVSAAEAAPPSISNKDVPPEVDAVVMKALSKDRQDRYDSGTEMAAALDSLKLAYARRDLASLVDDTFPVIKTVVAQKPTGDPRRTMLPPAPEAYEEGDTEISVHGEPIDGITAPERAVSAPHLVLLPGDSAVIDDAPDIREVSMTGRDLEIEAEPSGVHAPQPTSIYKPRSGEVKAPTSQRVFSDEAEDRVTARSPAAATRSGGARDFSDKDDEQTRERRPGELAVPRSEQPEQKSFPAAETMAAPLDEIRPTRVYDPGQSPAIQRVREDFDGRPTSIFDAAAAVAAARTVSGDIEERASKSAAGSASTPPSVSIEDPSTDARVSPASSSVSVSPSLSPDQHAAASPAAQGSMFEARPPNTDAASPGTVVRDLGAARPPVGSAFEDEAPPTRQPLPAQPRAKGSRAPMFILGGLLGAAAVVAIVVGLRYGIRRGAESRPAAVEAAAPTELAAPSAAEPRLPAALPQPLPAEDGKSLVGLDRKGEHRGDAKPEPRETKPEPRAEPLAQREKTEKKPTSAERSERAERTKGSSAAPAASGDGDDAAPAAKPTNKAGKGKGSVKEGRIVDPFEDGE